VQVKLTNMEGVVKFVKDEMPVKALEIENGGLRLKLRGGYRGCIWHGIWVFGVWWSPVGSSFWAGCCCRGPPKLTLLLSFSLLLFFVFCFCLLPPLPRMTDRNTFTWDPATQTGHVTIDNPSQGISIDLEYRADGGGYKIGDGLCSFGPRRFQFLAYPAPRAIGASPFHPFFFSFWLEFGWIGSG
jgi:hypothetical protein